jgi:hypothetical protein
VSSSPTPYTIGYNFTAFQAADPDTPLPADMLDAEHGLIRTSLNQTISRLAEIQRADGAVRNGVVTPDSLSAATLALLASGTWIARGAWVTATAYAIGDLVSEAGGVYVAIVAHTSGTFATDLAAAKWMTIQQQSATSTTVSFTPAGGVAAVTVQAAIEEVDSEAAKKASNLSDLASVVTARYNLALSRGASLRGLVTTNNVALPNTRIDVTAGECLDSTGAVVIVGGAMTKKIDALWAAGDTNGGLATGVVAENTTYHFFVIRKDSDLTADYLFDTSLTAANKPAGYTYFRRLWSIMTDGSSNIRAFLAAGDTCYWTVPPLDHNGAATSAAWTAVTLTVPAGLALPVFGTLQSGDGGTANSSGMLALRNGDGSDAAPASDLGISIATALAGSTDEVAATWGLILTSTARQIGYYATAAAPRLYLRTRGYIDQRRI